jgi:hypothetical protein
LFHFRTNNNKLGAFFATLAFERLGIFGAEPKDIRNGMKAPNATWALSAPACRQISAPLRSPGRGYVQKHALNLLFPTDRLPDEAFDDERGLTREGARVVSEEPDYGDFEMICGSWPPPSAPRSASTLTTSSPMLSDRRSLSNA